MKRIIFTFLLVASLSNLFAQTNYQSASSSTMIQGTSTLHNWEMKSDAGKCTAIFTLTESTITKLSGLTFNLQAESMKSGTKGLDKNAYKSLNTEKFPVISYSSSFANIHPNGTNSYIMSTKGKLTIAGVSKEVWISVVCNVNPADQSVQAKGSYKLKMSEFKIDPPSFMFGAMKTGDEVTVTFNCLMKK